MPVHEHELELPGAVEVRGADGDSALVADEVRHLRVETCGGGQQGDDGDEGDKFHDGE